MDHVTFQSVLDWANLTLSAYLFIHGVCTLNLMSRKTPVVQRVGYSFFTVGVFACLVGPSFGVYKADLPSTLILTGLGLYYSYRNYKHWLRYSCSWLVNK